jgi:tetratricopeptide (TPR) repeat protein
MTVSAQPEDHAMNLHLTRILSLAALTLALSPAFASGGGGGSGSGGTTATAAPDKFASVRAHQAAKQWAEALDELKRMNDTGSADWNNLMGYNLRKGKTPDLEAAQKYYDEALRIDPKHRGTLEYSGELALMKGDLATAEQRLAALDKLCFFPCEEYTDLKKAIEHYKATGNKLTQSN